MGSRKPSPKDYYAVLGVSPESDSAEIKKAYRALVQKYHPDRLRGTEESTNASERMIEINEAFAVLGDVKRRAELNRDLAAEKAPPAPAGPSVQDWEIPLSPVQERGAAPAKRNVAVDQSVAREFLDKVKAQLLSEGGAIKFKEEDEPSWRWSVQGKTWGGNYWVGVRSLSLLNPNTAREMIGQLQALIDKRRSGWKNNFFVFIFAFETLQEGETVLKMLRAFAGREENSTSKNLVNIVVLDLNKRRSVLCGKKSGDLNCLAILHALGVS